MRRHRGPTSRVLQGAFIRIWRQTERSSINHFATEVRKADDHADKKEEQDKFQVIRLAHLARAPTLRSNAVLPQSLCYVSIKFGDSRHIELKAINGHRMSVFGLGRETQMPTARMG